MRGYPSRKIVTKGDLEYSSPMLRNAALVKQSSALSQASVTMPDSLGLFPDSKIQMLCVVVKVENTMVTKTANAADKKSKRVIV